MITHDEKNAILNCMDAMRNDPQAGPVGLGSIVTLEALLDRNGYDRESPDKTTYDYYVQFCGENNVTPLPAGEFPSGLQELKPIEKDGHTWYVEPRRVYYHTQLNILCQIVANYWEDGACFVGERYTDDITDSYFTTERYQLREVLP